MTGRAETSASGPVADYEAREKRFYDAVCLTKPDRVPLIGLADLFLTRYSGLTHAEAFYDYDKAGEAWKRSIRKLNWDMVPQFYYMLPGPVMELFGLKTLKWPGYNLDDNMVWQYIENEYMMDDEYDELLSNQGEFIIRKVLPRMATALEPLAMLPRFTCFAQGYIVAVLVSAFAGLSPMTQLMGTLVKAGQEMNKYNAHMYQLDQDLMQMGYPSISKVVTTVPFDFLCVHLRGMEGTFLDMYRQPNKLKTALEMLTPFIIESAISDSQMSGNTRVGLFPLRGSSEFMSDKHFAEFYWPGLKQVILSLIDAGLTPVAYFQSDYMSRLKYLAELPPGKIASHFEKIYKKKFRDILGDKMVFWGDIPPSLLITGTPEQVKDYVKELIDTFGDTGGLIVDGAVGFPAETKPENAEAVTEAVFTYGVY